MSVRDGWREAGPSFPVQLFLALVHNEPAWRRVVLDLADPRPGGFVFGSCAEGLRLTCANHHTGEEMDLPASEIHAFVVLEGPDVSACTLARIRAHRAAVARERLASAKAPQPRREVVDWAEEFVQAASVTPGCADDDDVAAAGALLDTLFRSHPGPWRLAQVTRAPATGGLWGFGLDGRGDLLVAAHDVEARRARQQPTLQWLPLSGRLALERFLELERGGGDEV